MKTRIVLAAAMIASTSWTWGEEPGPGPRQGAGEGGRRGQERRQEMGRPMPGDREEMGPMGELGGGLEGGMVLRFLENERLVKELGITGEQIEGLKKNAENMEAETKKLRTEMEEAAMQQARLISQKAVDEDAVLEAVENTGRIRTEMAKLRIRQLLTVKKLLTPEQMEKLKEMREQRMRDRGGPLREEMKERMRERMEKGGGAGREEMKERMRERAGKFRKGGDKGERDEKDGEADANKPGMENFRE